MADQAFTIASPACWEKSLSEPLEFEEIFNRYVDQVHRFLYARLGNREDAEDLTSEVFMKAHRLLDRRRSQASIAQWLFTVARTVLADHWRRYYRGGATLPLEDWNAFDTDPVAERQDNGKKDRIVQEVLDGLPERYRRVLELRFLSGYTIEETARELAITPENAKVIQHRALAKAVKVGVEP